MSGKYEDEYIKVVGSETLVRIIEELSGRLRKEIDLLHNEGGVKINLTLRQKRLLRPSGTPSYGFFSSALSIAEKHKHLMPSNFNIKSAGDNFHAFRVSRQFVAEAEELLQIAKDIALLQGDRCHKDGLIVYNTLKGQAKANTAGADTALAALSPYFAKSRKKEKKEKEVEEK